MNQDELAAIVGLTRTSISNIERGVQNCTIESLYTICVALRVEAWSLLPRLDEMQTPVLHEFWQRLEDEAQP